MNVETTERRLSRVGTARLEATEEIRVWCLAWVSRDLRLHRLLAARTRDYAVLTDRRLLLFSSGFFTRRPRRRVLADRLDEMIVTPRGPEPPRCLRIESPTHRPLRLEVGHRERDQRFVASLLEAVGRRSADGPAAVSRIPSDVPVSPGEA